MKYAKLFIQIREELNMTQIEFAKKMKSSQSIVSKIESGISKPSTELFIRVARTTWGSSKQSAHLLNLILFP